MIFRRIPCTLGSRLLPIFSLYMHLSHLFKRYFEYILYFLGVGFISGSLVHYTTDPSYYTIIILVGIVIFTATSIFQARDDERRKVGIVKVTFTSLALSLGIGLLSGGIQHFKDVPTISPLFIVLGIVISLIAYIFRENIQLSSKQVIHLSANVGLVGIVSYLLLVQISLPYIGQSADEHHSQTSNKLTIDTPNGNTSRTHSIIVDPNVKTTK